MIVLDTNVVSYIFNRDDRALYYLGRVEGQRAVVSFQTIEELWFGAIKAHWSARRKNELERHIERYEVILPELNLAMISARLRSERERAGRSLSTADAWIASTAILLNCPLASHDRDFTGISGLDIIRAP